MPIKFYDRNDVARGVQDYYDRKPARDLQRQQLRSREEAGAAQRQAALDVKALDAARYKEAQIQASPIRSITAGSGRPTAQGGAPSQQPVQPSMISRRVSAYEGVPGGGAAAQAIMLKHIAGVSKDDEYVFNLLKAGQANLAQQFAEKKGMKIPPSIFKDRIVREAYINATEQCSAQSKNVNLLNVCVGAILEENPDVLERMSQSMEAGRGLPKGLDAMAKKSEQMGRQKVADTMALQKAKQDRVDTRAKQKTARTAASKYPPERMRLEYTKMYSSQKDEFGVPLYTPEKVRQLVNQMMSPGSEPIQKPTPLTPGEWLKKNAGR